MDYQVAIAIQLFDHFTRPLFEMKRATEEFYRNVEKAEEQVKSFGNTLKKAFDPNRLREFSEHFDRTARNIAEAVALPLAGLGGALYAYEEMENARKEMEVAFMTKEGLPKELEEINRQVEKLGVVLPGSTKDFYEVATALKAAGLSAKDIAGGIFEAASYAWVLFKKEVSPAQAAEYMAQFANAFKVPAGQFKEFVNQLQKLAYASGLSLTQIAYSVKYFSAQLNQLGITGLKGSKLIFTWLGTLKQMGIAGETAGTAIGEVLNKIKDFSKNLKKLEKEQGISLNIDVSQFYDEKGGFKLEQFLMRVRNELSKIQDPLQRMSALKTLFGDVGMRAIAPLLATTKEEALELLKILKQQGEITAKEYQELKKQIEEGGFSGLEKFRKAMEKQAELQQRIKHLLSSFANVREAFFGTLVGFGAVIGEILAPPLIKLFNFLNDLFGKLTDFIRQHQTLSKVIAYTVGSVVSFLSVLGTTCLVISSVTKIFALAITPLQHLGAILPFLTSSLRTFLTFTLRLGPALRAVFLTLRSLNLAMIANPWGLVIAGAVISALLIIKYWDKLKSFFLSLFKKLASAFNWLKENRQKALQVFLYLNPFTSLIMVLNKLVRYISGINLFNAGVKIVKSLWEGMKSFASKPVEIIKSIAQKIRNFLPFSPAKEGPLADLHRIKLIETIAETIKPAPLIASLKSVLEVFKKITADSVKTIISSPIAIKSTPLSIPGSSNISISVHFGDIHIPSADTKSAQLFVFELEKQIREVLHKISVEKFRRSY